MENVSYIGIGSNQGDKYANCSLAVEQIAASNNNRLIDQSSIYLTEPWGYREQEDFINQVIKIETSLSALGLLAFLQAVERRLLKEITVRWGPRTIDLDILFYNDEILVSPQLTLPHAHLYQRKFVLLPLQEIAPRLVHPVYHKQVTELLDSLDDSGRVTKLDREPL